LKKRKQEDQKIGKEENEGEALRAFYVDGIAGLGVTF
jgi:hypothetical protein